MLRHLFLILFGLQILLIGVTGQDLSGLKKRVAVINFEDRSGYGHNIGTGLADMLITQLVKSGKFIVIERQELEKVLQEQSLGMSGMVTAQSAARVGKLLGVELIVTGSVTEFGQKETKIGGALGRIGIGGAISRRKARAVVDIRLVNSQTGEIVMAESAVGEATSTSLDHVRFEDIDFGNPTTWDQTILGKAARKAIEQCVRIIDRAMARIPWQGKIIKVNPDSTLYMKPGSRGGVQPGMEFVVYSPGEEIIDPDTGLSLGSEEYRVGRIRVIRDIGDGRACKAVIISGSGFKVGDLVRIR
ncbi:MAG: hypothetical protein GXO78_11750 [Calditrichaeota bacterium]|nr:hypothetical protein [Calditrichota bacterium]